MKFKVGDLVKSRTGKEFIIKEIVESLDRYYLRPNLGIADGICSSACTLIRTSQSNYYFY